MVIIKIITNYILEKGFHDNSNIQKEWKMSGEIAHRKSNSINLTNKTKTPHRINEVIICYNFI